MVISITIIYYSDYYSYYYSSYEYPHSYYHHLLMIENLYYYTVTMLYVLIRVIIMTQPKMAIINNMNMISLLVYSLIWC